MAKNNDLDFTGPDRRHGAGRRKTDTLIEAFKQLGSHAKELAEHSEKLDWLREEVRAVRTRVKTIEDIWDSMRLSVEEIKTQGMLTYKLIEHVQEKLQKHLAVGDDTIQIFYHEDGSREISAKFVTVKAGGEVGGRVGESSGVRVRQ